MNEEIQTYIQYRMQMAAEALAMGEEGIKKGFLHSAVNRLYYACFYMVTALLLIENMQASKHSGVEALFNRHWIATGRLPVALGKHFSLMMKRRHQSDYVDMMDLEPEQVANWQADTKRFIETLRDEISGHLR